MAFLEKWPGIKAIPQPSKGWVRRELDGCLSILLVVWSRLLLLNPPSIAVRTQEQCSGLSILTAEGPMKSPLLTFLAWPLCHPGCSPTIGHRIGFQGGQTLCSYLDKALASAQMTSLQPMDLRLPGHRGSEQGRAGLLPSTGCPRPLL